MASQLSDSGQDKAKNRPQCQEQASVYGVPLIILRIYMIRKGIQPKIEIEALERQCPT
jgi:hypothetical protein